MTEKELYREATKKIKECLERLKKTEPFIYTNLELITKIITKIPQTIISPNLIGPLPHSTTEQNIQLVREFFRSINPEYEKRFVKYYESDKITMNSSEENIHLYKLENNEIKTTINIQKRETLKDALALVHEYFHELNVNLLDYRQNLTESISITAELLFLEFLKTKGVSEYDLDLLLSDRKKFFRFNTNTLNILLPILMTVKEGGDCDETIYDKYLFKYIRKETYHKFINNEIIKPDYKNIIRHVATFRHTIGTIGACNFCSKDKKEELYKANEYLREDNIKGFEDLIVKYMFEDNSIENVIQELNKYHPKKYIK